MSLVRAAFRAPWGGMEGRTARHPALIVPILLALLMGVLLFTGGPGAYAPRSIKHAWDLGHVAAFMLWTGLPAWLSPRWRAQPLTVQAATILGLTLVCGAGIEWLQGGVGRSSSYQDMARNFLGAALALRWLPPYRSRWPRRMRRAGGCALAAAGLAALMPLSLALLDEALARRQFPVLAAFDSPLETGRWTGSAKRSRVRLGPEGGGWVLRLELDQDPYAGAFLEHAPGNWKGYALLQLDFLNPDADPLDVTLRIHDQRHGTSPVQLAHDRFNRRFRLHPGWNRVRVSLAEVAAAPRDRSLDLGRVAALGFFATALLHPRMLYLAEIRLLREGEATGAFDRSDDPVQAAAARGLPASDSGVARSRRSTTRR